MVVGSTRREGGAGDAHRLTSALLLTDLPLRRRICLSPARFSISRRRRTCRQSDFDLVARLRFLFVRPCAARSSAQVTWTRGRGHPTVPGARWRSPLALTSDHPPPIHPFVFEAVAPRKLVSQLREITFSGPLASFVGKNFDTRQDACWGQLRDEAVCSPPAGTH